MNRNEINKCSSESANCRPPPPPVCEPRAPTIHTLSPPGPRIYNSSIRIHMSYPFQSNNCPAFIPGSPKCLSLLLFVQQNRKYPHPKPVCLSFYFTHTQTNCPNMQPISFFLRWRLRYLIIHWIIQSIQINCTHTQTHSSHKVKREFYTEKQNLVPVFDSHLIHTHAAHVIVCLIVSILVHHPHNKKCTRRIHNETWGRRKERLPP